MQALPHRYYVCASAESEGDVTLKSDGLSNISSDAPAEFGGPGDLTGESDAPGAHDAAIGVEQDVRAEVLLAAGLGASVDLEFQPVFFCRLPVSSIFTLIHEC